MLKLKATVLLMDEMTFQGKRLKVKIEARRLCPTKRLRCTMLLGVTAETRRHDTIEDALQLTGTVTAAHAYGHIVER